MRNLPQKEIKSLDEISEPNVYYFVVDDWGNRLNAYGKDKHVLIEYDSRENEYIVHYQLFRHQLYGFETKGGWVRTWKTFSGARRFVIKNYSKYFEV